MMHSCFYWLLGLAALVKAQDSEALRAPRQSDGRHLLATPNPVGFPTATPTISGNPTVSSIPTVTPPPTSLPPTVAPTTAGEKYSNESWEDIWILSIIEVFFGGCLLILFECLREKKNLYSPRLRWHPDKVPPPQLRGFAGWIRPVLTTDGELTATLVGLDAYMMLRFIRLCLRLTLFYTAWVLILVPIYKCVGNDTTYTGFNSLTLNHVESGSNLLWLPTGVCVLFTMHFYYLVDYEYKNFVEWRIAFLSGQRADIDPQCRTTVMITGVPQPLQSAPALQEYLEMILPGEVFCANVQIRVRELERLHDMRIHVVDRLERAIAFETNSGETATETVYETWYDRLQCQGKEVKSVEYYRDQLDELNTKVAAMQKEILERKMKDEEADEKKLEGLSKANQGMDGLPLDNAAPLFDVYRSSNPDGPDPTAFDHVAHNLNEVAEDTGAIVRVVGRGIGKEATGLGNQLTKTAYLAGDVVESLTDAAHPYKTSVAFVSMKSEYSASILASAELTHQAYTMKTQMAPEARDVIWKDIHVAEGTRWFRQITAIGAFFALALFWSSLVSVCAAFGQADSEVYTLLNIATDSYSYDILTAYAPPTIQLGLLMLIPITCEFEAKHYELCQSNTEVQLTVLSRYFNFQILSIFITISAGTLSSYLTDLYENPYEIPTILASDFPTVGAYFVELLVIKVLFGLPWELSRFWPATQYLFAHIFGDKRKQTSRSLRTTFLGFPELLYGWIYPSLLSVIIIAFTYNVITPMVSPFALAYFIIAELVYKNQALYVYCSKAEGGGLMWNSVFNRLMLGLVFGHLLLFGFLFTKSGDTQYAQPTIIFFVLIADLVFYLHCVYAYQIPSAVISLERAAEIARRNKQRADGGIVAKFSVNLYEQPALRLQPVTPEPFEQVTPVFLAGSASRDELSDDFDSSPTTSRLHQEGRAPSPTSQSNSTLPPAGP